MNSFRASPRCFTNARVYSYSVETDRYTLCDALVVEAQRVVSLDANDAGVRTTRIDLGGCTVLPAFADCHVHITDTGYMLGPRNLSATRSYAEFAASIARLPRDRYVFGGNYDESDWNDGKLADAAPLERFFSDSFAMVTRVDGHSCIVNQKTLQWLALPALCRGIERDESGKTTGKLFLDANWQAQFKFFGAIPEHTRRGAEEAATEVALSRGALHLHAQLVGFEKHAYAAEVAALRGLRGPKWYPKICEPDPALAKSLGLPFVGGDVFLDGSIGSCTAAVSEPFLSSESAQPHGALNYEDDELLRYFRQAEQFGIAAGVHAIGDRAIEQCISTWERVLNGRPATQRHFIEHFEIARQDQIDRCARIGIHLSMQPQFDLLWGGAGNMYEQRLGRERMRTMNALGRAMRAGVVLCGGSDSPVCELAPLLGMHAAAHHHEPSERLSTKQALTMYTYNPARLAGVEQDTGRLASGLAADFVVLDRDPIEDGNFAAATVLQTWRDGELVYEKP
ncbi:MAG: amidohydrolase family protein [Candidatus Eremiobacteraeota bacterium]|nr:amidohydrolase family protein [Candidatus Eremiobacteraeota bacterium]